MCYKSILVETLKNIILGCRINKMTQDPNFNNEKVFVNDLVGIVAELLQKPLKEFLRCSLETHNMAGLKKILGILQEFNFDKE